MQTNKISTQFISKKKIRWLRTKFIEKLKFTITQNLTRKT